MFGIRNPLKKGRNKKRSKNSKEIGELMWESINLENEPRDKKVRVI